MSGTLRNHNACMSKILILIVLEEMVRGVSEVGDDLPGDDFADGGHVLLGDAHDPHGLHGKTELLSIVSSRDCRVAIT